MTGPLYRLGTFCVRHRFVVAPLGLVLAVEGEGHVAERDASAPKTGPTARTSAAGER